MNFYAHLLTTNIVDIRRVKSSTITILYDVLFTRRILEIKCYSTTSFLAFFRARYQSCKDVFLRFLPTQQLPQWHLEAGRGHRGAADRGGDQAETEAAAEPVLPEHRPAQGEPAPC